MFIGIKDRDNSRTCNIWRVEAVSLLKMMVHKQFCCARAVWKDTWLVELVQGAILYRPKEILVTQGNTGGHMGPKQYIL